MGILDAAAEEKARALQGCDASRMGIQGISASFREYPLSHMEHGKGFRLLLGLKGQE
ncbi:hypothetical protein POSPLADRAFT_1063463 [Postia placenta MAD-698-R-SB12]|uniref:Uncharacterized protein n=1 Tax=Postia placenta MAD-698-R-SB12 TaxID=670580 RepID=A0A1X6MID9_9APHY|nr:hypothetical protein POSPLADRAFT_1063463 [Postia placenta MAD-698-R-SB12]OSX55823.1 hypothetical protein POSPLADRAFT_1063463 [Postia placenta MAD-698-R-SB12]